MQFKVRTDWLAYGDRLSWHFKPTPLFYRFPVIRHIRYIFFKWQVEKHYAFWSDAAGGVRTGFDDWVLYGIWYGWV